MSTINHNIGYQNQDKHIIDYELWTFDKINWKLRGPKPNNIDKEYFSSIGAAGTFGRYCKKPYTQQLADKIQINGFNLGVSGAGPSFFNHHNYIFDFINNGAFCVIEIFSGRSIYNDVFDLGYNQGQIKYKNSNSNFQPAENLYREILTNKTLAEKIKEQNRINYLKEMSILSENIKTKKVLLYLSKRTPEYNESYNNIKNYWGGFPHFINRSMINSMKQMFDIYIECVNSDGLPVQLDDNTVNNYYHSQEMHNQACKDIYEKL